MTHWPKEEKTKPYQLVKYFTFTSLVVVFIGALVLSVLFTHWVRSLHQKQSEDYARLLIENLNHQVFYQFNIPVAWKFEKIQLRNKAQFELMDNVVRNTLHSFKVDMVNIYNLNNVISYSFDKNLIGKGNIGDTSYQKAVAGNSSSKLVQRGSFLEIFFGFPKEVKIITVAPLRAENPTLIFVKGKGIVFSPLKRKTSVSEQAGPVLGVFEIVQDLTEDYRTIFRFQQLVVLSCTTVMGILFIVLRFVVKRGENILARRAEEQLMLKEKLNRAERLSALGELTAGISHEIRNPLGIIHSSADLLKKKMKIYDPANKIPDIIVEETSRLNTLITDFLNFAKPKALNLTPTHVEEVLNKNLVFLDSQIKEKQIIVNKRINTDLKPMMADQAMLYQAFLNILINAMQAMGHGGNINIEATSKNDAIEIIIKDNGSGIPDENLTKIWDPFFTTKESGTGLGLGIVRNIISSHGGSMQLQNQPEGGVAVSIFLPYTKETDLGYDSNR